jgi:uracil-DNA glycosylase family 4
MRNSLSALTDELRRLKASGVSRIAVSDEALAALRRSVERRPVSVAVAKAAPTTLVPTSPEAGPPVSPPIPPPPIIELAAGDKAAQWEAIRRQVLEDPVCTSRIRPGKKVVLGVGSLDAALMFIGEAPGAEEEVQGEPFVGPAGQLLNRMIAGMGLSRGEVYIGNIMNWRPELPVGKEGVQSGNRPPTEAEMAYCLPYLRAQIEIVKPRLLVALGATAAKGLLGHRAFTALSEVRGRWHDLGGRPLMVTYHPSYVLRNPTNQTKRLIWEDLLKVMERANLTITERQRNFFL